MATNKHAQIRYNTLDKCFRNPGRQYTLEDLLEECNRAIYGFDPNSEGIKRRQLYDDIRYMESEQGWSIELAENIKQGRKRVYRYVDSNFSISNQPLNEADANHLKSALLTLSRFKGLPQFDWVNELTIRLEDSFSLTKETKDIISFEENEYLKGKEHITQLYNAIHYKKVLKIKYKNFKSEEPQIFILHPYYLKQYNNRWFLFGKNRDFENLTNLALDRIIDIEEANGQYLEADINFNEYFEDVIGVSVNEVPIQKILLKVSKNAINYIKTKPLHGSQKIKEENDRFTWVELELIPNYELESQILSFGDNIEVVHPLNLREGLKERIELLLTKYKT
ncbi:MAG: WYL domain-containing protein [Flavobacteriaceae bacterium]|nr:WYL domain-containing protein [Flavobacteriaceae bacterium]